MLTLRPVYLRETIVSMFVKCACKSAILISQVEENEMAEQKNACSDEARLSCSCRDRVMLVSLYSVFLHFYCAVEARSTSQMITTCHA